LRKRLKIESTIFTLAFTTRLVGRNNDRHVSG
jgi:hypothetical protein